jgi:hypothetical protein
MFKDLLHYFLTDGFFNFTHLLYYVSVLLELSIVQGLTALVLQLR